MTFEKNIVKKRFDPKRTCLKSFSYMRSEKRFRREAMQRWDLDV